MTYADFQELRSKHQHALKLNPPKSGMMFKLNSDSKREETALRRFEIVFLTTLPLTMFISFTLVQLYEMQQQKTSSPVMSEENLQFVIGFSVTSSTVIAIKDLIRWKKSKQKDDQGK
jgi:hypothetical protein